MYVKRPSTPPLRSCIGLGRAFCAQRGVLGALVEGCRKWTETAMCTFFVGRNVNFDFSTFWEMYIQRSFSKYRKMRALCSHILNLVSSSNSKNWRYAMHLKCTLARGAKSAISAAVYWPVLLITFQNPSEQRRCNDTVLQKSVLRNSSATWLILWWNK